MAATKRIRPVIYALSPSHTDLRNKETAEQVFLFPGKGKGLTTQVHASSRALFILLAMT